jgi:hypothetical protein
VVCSAEARGRAWALAEGRRKEEGKTKRKEKEKGKRKGKKGGEKGKKDLEKIEEILGKKSGGKVKGFFVGFSGFSGAGVISGITVMARRGGRRDRSKPEIPDEVADRGAVVALGGTTRWPG